MTKNNCCIFTIIITLFFQTALFSQDFSNLKYNAIYSGIPWLDNNGEEVNAHGACIIKEKDTYYLFGEAHTDTSNAFVAFNCYSSKDLYNWKFENQVLKVQKEGFLGPNRIGERVKVMKCPKTGEFIMYMHTDDIGYRDPHIGFATSSTITGEYTFQGALLFNEKPIKMWDMGTFQDDDGTGYLLIHEGNIYKLAEDYKTITTHLVKDRIPGAESPAMFKKDGIYYWIGSNKTSWERNDNFYHTATSIGGPWTEQGLFAPAGKLTWNSQSTFILPIVGTKETTYMYMGDRWSYPRQKTAATYVWQPFTVSGTSLSIPTYNEAWQINTNTGVWNLKKIDGKTTHSLSYIKKSKLNYSGKWTQEENENKTTSESKTNESGAFMQLKFKGTRVHLFGISNNTSGYAKVEILDKKGNTLQSSIIDFYSKYAYLSSKFSSPSLKKANYILKITALGEHGNWSNKAGTIFGSTNNYISIHSINIEK